MPYSKFRFKIFEVEKNLLIDGLNCQNKIDVSQSHVTGHIIMSRLQKNRFNLSDFKKIE